VATIDITRPHTLGPDGARRAADAIAARLRAEYGVRSWWDGPALHVAGRGIDGRLDAGPETVRVTARLGLLARAFAGPLRREIERELDRVAPLS
jgi:putative polyhydroxyalkanoate system protein